MKTSEESWEEECGEEGAKPCRKTLEPLGSLDSLESLEAL